MSEDIGEGVPVETVQLICECCGQRLIDGRCSSCDEDRRQGEEFVREHGMPDFKELNRQMEEKYLKGIISPQQFSWHLMWICGV